jgi:flavin reductase (DIM6/NTAB) family NADH-FMN oxidoreductase RutF
MEKKMSNVARLVPCSVVLLSVAGKQKKDAMTATCMFVSEDPAYFVVSVAKSSATYRLIEESAEFVLNIASAGQVKLAKALGATHGARVDKFSKFKIGIEKSKAIASPGIKGSYAFLECRVVTSYPVGKYVIYLAEAVASRVDEKAVPLAWLSNRYFALKDPVG